MTLKKVWPKQCNGTERTNGYSNNIEKKTSTRMDLYLQKDCKRKFRPVIKNKQMLIG